MLEASIALDEPGFTELSEAIAEHKAAQPKSPQPKRRPRRETGERHRAADLRDTEGWSWTLPFRRLDDLELVMREVHAMERQRARRERDPELV
jgi:hypothetical protein